jgi:hypothetical protein
MADKNIQMTQRNSDNNGWDNLFPITKDINVIITDPNNRFAGTKLDQVLDELFTFANDGKTQIANAITAKGVSADPTETFTSLAAKIGQISTGKKWASGTINSYTPQTTITVNDLSFTPSIIIIQLRESDTTSSLYDTYYWKIYTPINKVINRWRAMGNDRDWSSGSELTWETSITIQSNGFTYSEGMPGSSTPSRNTVTWWAFE